MKMVERHKELTTNSKAISVASIFIEIEMTDMRKGQKWGINHIHSSLSLSLFLRHTIAI